MNSTIMGTKEICVKIRIMAIRIEQIWLCAKSLLFRREIALK